MTATLTRLRDTVVRAAYSRTMAMPVERLDHACFPVTVSAVRDLTPRLRRLTLAAPELSGYRTLGPDEFFGLVMPPAGHPLPPLPQDGSPNPRGAFDHLPEAEQPAIRWYTVRAHRPAAGELDVDVVTHGDAGPGSAWVLEAAVGSVAGFQTGTACYRTDAPSGDHVVVGDETAVPAISAILEQQRDDVTTHVFVEVPERADVTELLPPAQGSLTVLERGAARPGSLLVPAVAAAAFPTPVYAWVAGEQSTVTQVRRHLVGERSMDRRSVYFCPYWILGRPRG